MLDVECLEDVALIVLSGEWWGGQFKACVSDLSEFYMYVILFMLSFMYIFEREKSIRFYI